jgi:uncharacterized protein YndB with AHSA1/START domain
MTEPTQSPLVRHQVVVPGTPERAFAAFTQRFDAIKPREHNLLGVPIVSTTFEPRVGGNIVDRGGDGSECRWARVLVFDPPVRVVFTWDIGPTWQLEASPENSSEVEVRFIAEGPDRTRVELEHRHLDRHGPGWPQLRAAVDDEQGWPLYLARYASVLREAA